jgi:hypothetical protein
MRSTRIATSSKGTKVFLLLFLQKKKILLFFLEDAFAARCANRPHW